MKKPNKNLLRLCDMDYIKSIDVDYRQTGTDTADTYVTISAINGVLVKGLWSTYKDYLDVRISYNSVATVADSYIRQVSDWRSYKEENEADIREYERLKKKLAK